MCIPTHRSRWPSEQSIPCNPSVLCSMSGALTLEHPERSDAEWIEVLVLAAE